jgi:spore cortex formation protein SpoVR/YcgB (stage V sporulation)
VRELLASQYNLSEREPNIQIVAADIRGDRSLTFAAHTAPAPDAEWRH